MHRQFAIVAWKNTLRPKVDNAFRIVEYMSRHLHIYGELSVAEGQHDVYV